MAIIYRAYRNAGGGPSDPVNYSTVIASAAGSPITLPALPAPGDYLIAVRAYDSVAGLDDGNADAFVRIRIDASGANITALPNPPTDVAAEASNPTSLRVSWAYPEAGQGGAPAGFKVWANTGAINYAAPPKATVPFSPGLAVYSATLTGLIAGSTYSVAVRAYNGTGDEPNTTATASAMIPASGPATPEFLVAQATPFGR